ncbi:thymidylate kinase-like [Lytechinus pictus]|uniref:thymidylate kinase-like n=1 Tax=Lytechinus pictus TaxID=7653 RepID=UPI00240DE7A2|nr:thymidylate kinase-like [Lytechinus pictus]
MRRGALVVFEGCDRSGKSTQCKKLVDSLRENGLKAELMRFPERSTTIGKVIDSYLKKSSDVQDNAVHLLFSANRWELVPEMKRKLGEGVTLVVDRYAYSGVAFTAAKEGFTLDWCKQPDVGIPLPDLVLYLDISSEAAGRRGGFGEERYEKSDIQLRVAENFKRMQEDDWKVIDADQSMEDLHRQIKDVVLNVIDQDLPQLGTLWTKKD